MSEIDDRELSMDTMIIWECTHCGKRDEWLPGWNENAECSCGGTCVEVGMSYDARRRDE